MTIGRETLRRGALGMALAAAVAAPAALAAERPVQIEHAGLTLNGVLSTPEGEDMPQRVLLMTHGTLAHGEMSIMRNLQAALAERGIATLAHTLSLGVSDRTGMADCAITHTHTHADAVDEIAAWHDWLTQQGAEAVPVLGHSRGGNQVARFAATVDDPALTRVVLMAPSTWTAEAEAADYEARFGAPLSQPLDQARAMAEAGRGGETLEVPGFVYCENATVTADAFLGYHEADPERDTPAVLPRVEEPTLIVVAGADEVITDLPERLEQAGSQALEGVEVVTIDGADHMFLEFFTEDAADAIAEFLTPPGE